MKYLAWAVMAVVVTASPNLFGAVDSETVDYKYAGATLKGYLAWDPAVKGKRPGVLVVHEWWGLNDYTKHRTDMLAQLGYVAFAADMYGDGFNTTSADEAAKRSDEFKTNRVLGRERLKVALSVLRRHELCDSKRVAAIGYCFGGMCVLELARSGENVAGVVSFHGALNTPNPVDGRNIRCKVLACHGANDTFVPAEEVAAFEKEMRDAGVDWEMITYGGAVHGFTNPNADKMHLAGLAYNERADKHSWDAMKTFFAEIFK